MGEAKTMVMAGGEGKRMRGGMFLFLLTGALWIVGCDSSAGKEPAAGVSQAIEPTQQGGASAPQEDRKLATKTGSFKLAELEHEVVVGKSSAFAFEVRPGKDLKINPEYPWKFTLDVDGQKISLEQEATLKKGELDLNDVRARVPVKLKANEAGEHALSGTLNLSVCEKGDAARCLWFTDEPVELMVKAKLDEAPDVPGEEAQ